MSRLRDTRGRFVGNNSAVQVQRVGDSLEVHLMRDLQALEEGSDQALDDLGRRWRELVRETTWEHPTPSPQSKIIVERKGKARLDFGWIDYPGKPGAARARAEQRLDLFQEEAPKIINEALAKAQKRGAG